MASLSHHAMMTDEGLVTFFSEVESILNSRPLTPMSFVEDLERLLAPKDLLLIGSDSGLPPTNIDKSDIVFRNRWRHVQAHADLFWKRWAKEYLHIMNKRQKWFDKRRNVSENDVVILIDESTPRSHWPLGRVIKTFPDAHGLVRTAVVKAVQGEEYKRPISKMGVVIPENYVATAPAWLSNV